MNIKNINNKKTLAADEIWVFYVDSELTTLGINKFHLMANCHILRNRKTNKHQSELILQDYVPKNLIKDNKKICKFCLKN